MQSIQWNVEAVNRSNVENDDEKGKTRIRGTQKDCLLQEKRVCQRKTSLSTNDLKAQVSLSDILLSELNSSQRIHKKDIRERNFILFHMNKDTRQLLHFYLESFFELFELSKLFISNSPSFLILCRSSSRKYSAKNLTPCIALQREYKPSVCQSINSLLLVVTYLLKSVVASFDINRASLCLHNFKLESSQPGTTLLSLTTYCWRDRDFWWARFISFLSIWRHLCSWKLPDRVTITSSVLASLTHFAVSNDLSWSHHEDTTSLRSSRRTWNLISIFVILF